MIVCALVYYTIHKEGVMVMTKFILQAQYKWDLTVERTFEVDMYDGEGLLIKKP